MINTTIDENVLIRAAQLFGTPCLCYEQREIEHWAKKLRGALPERAEIIYSVKAAPNLALVKFYEELGFYFETASAGELEFLLDLKIPPDKIWISGQGKTLDYLRLAIEQGVRNFNLESGNELDLLSSLVTSKDNINCNLRINPQKIVGSAGVATSDNSSAFGIDEDQLSAIMAKNSAALINGIFVYFGSQFFYAEDIATNTRYCFDIAKKLYEFTRVPIKSVDFGGGFGVPESDTMPELDMDVLHDLLVDLFSCEVGASTFNGETKFFFESGRYLAARTAYLITTILDVKLSGGQRYVITDGGINCLGVKQKEYRLFPPYIHHIGKKCGTTNNFRIVGTTCTPIDLTHPAAELKSPQIGDYICIPDCGAYSLTFSPQNFNGFYAAAEVLHDEEKFISLVEMSNANFPAGRRECVPIGTGKEIAQLFVTSCPKESDEVQNITVIADFVKLEKFSLIVYDMSASGAEAVILLKILDNHYKISPAVVFSDFDGIQNYTDADCLPIKAFQTWANKINREKTFVLVVGSRGSEDYMPAVLSEVAQAGFSHFAKVESELIYSMDIKFYDYFLHHIPQLQYSFNLMADVISSRCFLEYLRTVLENDFWRLQQNSLSEKYWGYDKGRQNEFYRHLEDEVWLNVGACNGDTIFRFLQNGYSFSRICAIDSDADALRRCKTNLERLSNGKFLDKISFHEVALGCDRQSIDKFFGDVCPSLINMDIEGAENETLCGAANVIRRYRPVLVVCAYHRPEDLCVLPQTINSIADDYVFFLRKYPNFQGSLHNSREEIVLYAVPSERRT